MAKNELIILNRTGDLKLLWSAQKQGEIDAARQMFEDMRNQGYLAYTVTKDGDKGEVIRKFDPDAEKIIMAPQMQGG